MAIYLQGLYSKATMNELILFTDGSVATDSKIGFGAYLIAPDIRLPLDLLKTFIKIRKFENTSSTKLELQTLLWALNDIKASGKKLVVYTDSQNIVGLEGRRSRLEKNDFKSKKNRLLNNHELYQSFFKLVDTMNCRFVKIRGHKVSNQKDYLDKIFTLVDRASRKALRDDN